jgi:hypothetical protein
MNVEFSVAELFVQLAKLRWNHAVYLPASALTLETRCLVLDPNDVEPETDIPAAAATRGYTQSIGLSDVRSVEHNAQQQGKQPTQEEFLAALSYYLGHDAFIDFRKVGPPA